MPSLSPEQLYIKGFNLRLRGKKFALGVVLKTEKSTFDALMQAKKEKKSRLKLSLKKIPLVLRVR